MTEHQLQAACFQLFRMKYPNLAMNYYAIPNGIWSKNIMAALKCKKEGLTKGVADSFLMRANNGYHGLYIEFKTARGRLTHEQGEFIAAATAEGYKAVVIRSIDEFMKTVDEYLK